MNNLSFSSRVCHGLSLLHRLFPPQYIYIHASRTRPTIPRLSLLPLPYSDDAASLYDGVPFISCTFSHACGGNATPIRRRHHAFIKTRVDDKERKKRIQERTSGSCPYIFPLSDHLPVSQRTADQESYTIPLTVTMKQMVESFLCIWHTYWRSEKPGRINRDSVVGGTEGARTAYYPTT